MLVALDRPVARAVDALAVGVEHAQRHEAGAPRDAGDAGSVVAARRGDPAKAYVTIIEGCNEFCAFCVVPYTRGKERMRPARDIVADVRHAADTGAKEVQLLGQIVNHYQAPDEACDFADLLSRVNDVPGIERIRFASPHPRHVTPRMMAAMRDLPKVCRHLHLPVQSGSTRVLQAMRRIDAAPIKASDVLHLVPLGLSVRGRPVTDGDITFQVQLADDSVEYPFLATDLRQRSQEEKSTVFWAAMLNDAIDHETVEVHRSKEVLSRKERDARTAIETALIAEEKVRLRRHQEELRRLLREALLNGNVYFRGNDRSPAAGSPPCWRRRSPASSWPTC